VPATVARSWRASEWQKTCKEVGERRGSGWLPWRLLTPAKRRPQQVPLVRAHGGGVMTCEQRAFDKAVARDSVRASGSRATYGMKKMTRQAGSRRAVAFLRAWPWVGGASVFISAKDVPT
jgi:hypothetical protein